MADDASTTGESSPRWFRQWKARGVTERILHELREQIRLAEGRDPQPSAGVIDSQSVKGADTVGKDTRGYDAGKKMNGRKQFIVTDTLGLLVSETVLAASWQDRDGAKTTPLSVYLATPIRYVFADQGFAGKLVGWAQRTLDMTVDIVRKPAWQRGFEIHPKRWVVERTLAWPTAHRRLARDYERDPEVSEELIRWAPSTRCCAASPAANPPNDSNRKPCNKPEPHPSKTLTGEEVL